MITEVVSLTTEHDTVTWSTHWDCIHCKV